uniref:Uncharacterized protein n=1 Tax=Ditylenchus dipsaci TaxID=166011 RepID=A0A915DBX5_9BILA
MNSQLVSALSSQCPFPLQVSEGGCQLSFNMFVYMFPRVEKFVQKGMRTRKCFNWKFRCDVLLFLFEACKFLCVLEEKTKQWHVWKALLALSFLESSMVIAMCHTYYSSSGKGEAIGYTLFNSRIHLDAVAERDALVNLRFWLVAVVGGSVAVFGMVANGLLARLFVTS